MNITEKELQIRAHRADEHGNSDHASEWATGALRWNVYDAGHQRRDKRGQRVIVSRLAG